MQLRLRRQPFGQGQRVLDRAFGERAVFEGVDVLAVGLAQRLARVAGRSAGFARHVGFQVAELSPAEAETYLGLLVQPLVGRVLSAAEREQIVARGGAAVTTLVTAWATEPGFAEAARRLVQQKLSVSGNKDGIDFELPGHLAAYVVRHDLPWSTLITADHCVSAAGERIACDTGAPYTAGVLTTRAFLTSRASRFNLTRSSALMRAFACRKYPLEDTLQPRLDRLSLIPMFQAQTAEEQTDPRAQSGFGNGFGCYTCHGQFSAHAQLFVKFDEQGRWHADADQPLRKPHLSHRRIQWQPPRAAVASALQELTTTAQQAPYALVVVPLMAEKGRYPFLQSIIVVDCPESLQLDRLMRRDGISMMLAVQMLQAQANRAQRLAIADHLLSNDGSQAELTRSCERLHAYLLRQNSLHSAHV